MSLTIRAHVLYCMDLFYFFIYMNDDFICSIYKLPSQCTVHNNNNTNTNEYDVEIFVENRKRAKDLCVVGRNQRKAICCSRKIS